MARKTKQLNGELQKATDEIQKASEKLKEVERLKAEAEREEKELIDKIQASLVAIEKANNVFLGVILTKQDLVNVFSLALESGESIRIPVRIYFTDNE